MPAASEGDREGMADKKELPFSGNPHQSHYQVKKPTGWLKSQLDWWQLLVELQERT